MKEYESMIEVREAQEKQFTNDFYRLGTSKRVVNKSYGAYHRKGLIECSFIRNPRGWTISEIVATIIATGVVYIVTTNVA